MKADLVRIGNSRGIRIPKLLIEQCGFGEQVNLSVENQRLVISPERQPRAGWEEQLRAAAVEREDLLPGSNKFDREEWNW